MAQAYVHSLIETDGRGNETATPTPSTKVLYTPALEFSTEAGVAHLDRSDEVRGTDDVPSVVTEMYDPTWSLRTRAYPDVLGFYLWLMLGDPTTTAGDGIITDPDSATIPTGAHRHVWTAPFGPTGAYPLTAQFQPAWADQGFYQKVKGAAIETLSLVTPESGGLTLEASGPALYADDQANPSLSPAYESLSIKPFLYKDMTLPTWLSGAASSKSCSLTIEQSLEPDRDLGSGSAWRNELYRGDGPTRIRGSVEQALIDGDDWNALIAATGFAAVARWVSETVIASGYTYKLWVSMSNAQYVSGGPSPITNRRRIPASFDFVATTAGSASATITLVNATASYA